jgi:co-chaperonin GroES (HSP10)
MLNIKSIKPLANYLVVTKETYKDEDFDGIIQDKLTGSVKEYQKVIAVGPMVRVIQVGDLVSINPRRYAVTKYRPDSVKDNIEGMQKVVGYNIPEITINHEKFILITDQDVEFVIDEYEEEKSSNLILPKQQIIMP